MRFGESILLLVFAQAALWCGSATASENSNEENETLQRWDRVVCLVSQNKEKQDTVNHCTAFLVAKEERLFLITANHGANETHRESRLLYRDPRGKSQWVVFHALFSDGNPPWRQHANSDLAIAEIKAIAKVAHNVKDLRQLAVEPQHLQVELPPRTTAIDTAGFPLGLGAKGTVAPFAISGRIVSSELSEQNKWGTEPIVYCTPDLAQGCSGSPAFVAREVESNVEIAGMFIGVIFDQTGGKLSKMVPARVIDEALNAQFENRLRAVATPNPKDAVERTSEAGGDDRER